MMAFDPVARDAAMHVGLARFTDRTVTDVAVLRAQLPPIRDTGTAVCRDEREPGLGSDPQTRLRARRRVVATISLGVPTFRLGDAVKPPARLERWAATGGRLVAKPGQRQRVDEQHALSLWRESRPLSGPAPRP